MKEQYNLSREFYLRVLQKRPLEETESTYWKYQWFIKKDKNYNRKLHESVKLKRKEYLEEKIKSI